MPAIGLPLPRDQRHSTAILSGFGHWLRTHHGAIMIAVLLSYVMPITYFLGSVGVMREATPARVIEYVPWIALMGFVLSCLVLVIGYALQRLNPAGRYARGAAWLLGACAAATLVSISTAGQAPILVELGVVSSVLTMHLHVFTSSLIMALLYFAHLQRTVAYEKAAARLRAAQAGQREARRRMVQARLQAVQARIDPELLFDMLDAVRRCYEVDASSAEQLLDELIDFLRASLPRLRSASSSLPCEAELARTYARLRALAGASAASMTLEVPAGLLRARFPPGVLLPLLDDVLRTHAGPCALAATRSSDECRLVLTLPVRPSDAAVSRVRALLADLYGSAADLTLDDANGSVGAAIKVPYELE